MPLVSSTLFTFEFALGVPPACAVMVGSGALSTCDVVVLSGFHGDDPAAIEAERCAGRALVAALRGAGLEVGLATWAPGGPYKQTDRQDQPPPGPPGLGAVRAALSAAVDHANRRSTIDGRGTGEGAGARTGSEMEEEDGRIGRQHNNVRAMVIVGLGAGGSLGCRGFVSDGATRADVRRFAGRGGVVLLHGTGGAVDEVVQDWFNKPWSCGVRGTHERRTPASHHQAARIVTGCSHRQRDAWPNRSVL